MFIANIRFDYYTMIHARHIIAEPFIEALKNMIGGEPPLVIAMPAPENDQYRHHNIYANGFGTIAHEYVIWSGFHNKRLKYFHRDPLLIRFEMPIFIGVSPQYKVHLETEKIVKEHYTFIKELPESVRTYSLNGLFKVKEIRIYCYENKSIDTSSDQTTEYDILMDSLIAFVFDNDSAYYFQGMIDDRLGTLFNYSNNVSRLDELSNFKKDDFGNKIFKLRVVLN
jgi:hypothetical protein